MTTYPSLARSNHPSVHSLSSSWPASVSENPEGPRREDSRTASWYVMLKLPEGSVQICSISAFRMDNSVGL
ncbi:hypothetical protein FBU59_005916 [Linderina macrospora]|uniref:Uncharacterized protein n=1 Tax=Linderina macrospora TaxID=4868 RepID=A0ACC1J1C0_9FUNG|nr:hypothetical protein FBU59_005916 [Linderina macrospora]